MLYSVVIIGGGIVGLSTALKLKEINPSYKIAILDKEHKLGLHQTGHNSGVIHSGLYYNPNSLKAKNCINGYNMLLNFCKEEDIPYELCGKLVIATKEDELPILQKLYDNGIQNGLKDLKLLNSNSEIKEYEPYANGIKAIHVPQTGIVDYKLVLDKMIDKFVHFGGEIFPNHKVKKIKEANKILNVETNHKTFPTKIIINCAGLQSDIISKLTTKKIDYKIIPFRGEYYKLKKEKEYLVKNLIYPVPNPNFPFLGVHFTRHLNGGIEAGPNAVLALKREGYHKNDIKLNDFLGSFFYSGFLKVASKYWAEGFKEIYRSISKTAFTNSLQELVPQIQKKDLVKAKAGVRAQAFDKNGMIDDFLILEGKNFVNVGNAPSPAATSSLSIGETIAKIAVKKI